MKYKYFIEIFVLDVFKLMTAHLDASCIVDCSNGWKKFTSCRSKTSKKSTA